VSDNAQAQTADAAHAGGHHTNYVKIWGILLALLVVSVLGPMVGIKWLTLMTAFGIAIVKAYLVAANFMHLNIERKYVVYLLVVTLGLMGLFFIAVAPDVMKHEGANWTNVAAKAATARGLEEAARHHGEHGEGHEAPAAEHH